MAKLSSRSDRRRLAPLLCPAGCAPIPALGTARPLPFHGFACTSPPQASPSQPDESSPAPTPPLKPSAMPTTSSWRWEEGDSPVPLHVPPVEEQPSAQLYFGHLPVTSSQRTVLRTLPQEKAQHHPLHPGRASLLVDTNPAAPKRRTGAGRQVPSAHTSSPGWEAAGHQVGRVRSTFPAQSHHVHDGKAPISPFLSAQPHVPTSKGQKSDAEVPVGWEKDLGPGLQYGPESKRCCWPRSWVHPWGA